MVMVDDNEQDYKALKAQLTFSIKNKCFRTYYLIAILYPFVIAYIYCTDPKLLAHTPRLQHTNTIYSALCLII